MQWWSGIFNSSFVHIFVPLSSYPLCFRFVTWKQPRQFRLWLHGMSRDRWEDTFGSLNYRHETFFRDQDCWPRLSTPPPNILPGLETSNHPLIVWEIFLIWLDSRLLDWYLRDPPLPLWPSITSGIAFYAQQKPVYQLLVFFESLGAVSRPFLLFTESLFLICSVLS